MKVITPLVVSLALAATLTVQSALHAQQLPIQPAADGTGTIVSPAGSTFNITGGTTSSSGANLFQSFTNFGLSNGQVANFLSAPNTQNILSRVTGGSFSLIDGLLKVTGSNANLFLVNPSGIIFGPNASLNVPAAFTATTANSVAFGSQWFNALGQNDYAALNGSPSSLGFTMSKPGAIINAGNLSVGPGQALSLIGGTVASTGQLSGGQVTLAAVPGEHYVRLGQPGSPLSIEVPISGAQMPTNWDLPIYSLPELLTGTGAGLTVADDGTVQLVGSQLTVENGDVVARKIDAESAVLSASRNVTLPESQLATTKDLLIQARDTVTARDSKENPVLVKAGGNLTIQGDKSVDLLALNHPGQAFQSGGDLRLVSDGNVSGDAHFASGGTFSIETLAGKPGNFVSLYDPIISSGNNVSFGNYTGVALKVESLGSITGGNITITGPDSTLAGSDPDIPKLTSSSALILRAGTQLGNTNVPISAGNTTFTSGNITTSPSPGNITIGNVSTSGGPIILAATGGTSAGFLNSSGGAGGGEISLKAPQGVNLDSVNSGSGNITIASDGSNFINGTISGTGSLALQQFTPSKSITIIGSVLSHVQNGFGSITVGRPDSTGDITVVAPITFSDPLTLLTPGGSIFVNSQLTGADNASLTFNAITTVLNANVITNGNPITFDNSVQLGNTVTVATNGGNIATGAPITFANTVNATTAGGQGLTVNAGSGNTSFSGPVGNTQPLSSLIIDGASTIATSSIDSIGPISFTAAKNINTGNIATNGGNIALTSLRGTITAGTIDSRTANGGGAPITLTHQGKAFIVNNPLGSTSANDFSSSGTISSSSNNAISKGVFIGSFNKEDIAIIGPEGPNPDSSDTIPRDLPVPPRTDPSPSNSINEPSSAETVRAFEKYFEQSFNMEQLPIAELRDNLRRIETASGKKLSIINVDVEAKVLTLITPEDNTIVAIPRNVTSEALREKAALLRNEIADPSNVTSNRYLTTSRQLYGWLVAPLEKYLQEKKIDTLIFQLDAGMRLMPLAALNDGQHFLVEKYSLSLIPSINLLDTHYEPERVRSSKVLAMGATTFKDDIPLPAVPPELQNVSQYGGSVFLNDNFTLANLRAKTGGFGLIHLATHADFNRGKVQNSYIKLNDTRLSLNQMRDLGWNQQNVELLVLSACRTAVGDVNTELGFAGLAVGAGVKTAVATLWISSDLGTFGLMSEFYNDLKTASIKADALRSAQVAMLRGEVRIENGQLRVKKNTFPLPADLKALGEVRLTHPYYWSGFTMIGSPW
jgi:filamentous hemagglutinin family protein